MRKSAGSVRVSFKVQDDPVSEYREKKRAARLRKFKMKRQKVLDESRCHGNVAASDIARAVSSGSNQMDLLCSVMRLSLQEGFESSMLQCLQKNCVDVGQWVELYKNTQSEDVFKELLVIFSNGIDQGTFPYLKDHACSLLRIASEHIGYTWLSGDAAIKFCFNFALCFARTDARWKDDAFSLIIRTIRKLYMAKLFSSVFDICAGCLLMAIKHSSQHRNRFAENAYDEILVWVANSVGKSAGLGGSVAMSMQLFECASHVHGRETMDIKTAAVVLPVLLDVVVRPKIGSTERALASCAIRNSIVDLEEMERLDLVKNCIWSKHLVAMLSHNSCNEHGVTCAATLARYWPEVRAVRELESLVADAMSSKSPQQHILSCLEYLMLCAESLILKESTIGKIEEIIDVSNDEYVHKVASKIIDMSRKRENPGLLPPSKVVYS